MTKYHHPTTDVHQLDGIEPSDAAYTSSSTLTAPSTRSRPLHYLVQRTHRIVDNCPNQRGGYQLVDCTIRCANTRCRWSCEHQHSSSGRVLVSPRLEQREVATRIGLLNTQSTGNKHLLVSVCIMFNDFSFFCLPDMT